MQMEAVIMITFFSFIILFPFLFLFNISLYVKKEVEDLAYDTNHWWVCIGPLDHNIYKGVDTIIIKVGGGAWW